VPQNIKEIITLLIKRQEDSMPVYDQSTVREYLEHMRMSPLMQSRIEEFTDEYQAAIGSPPEFIFVENPIDALGRVEFSNLVLLSGTMYVEFSLNQPNRTITFFNINKNVTRIVMSDLQQSSFSGQFTESSRVTVRMFNRLEVIGYFEASGDNCGDLLDMLGRYFLPVVNS
jgi:hypothetical protein